MDIIIKETGSSFSFHLIDPKSGVNWVRDFVGNTGALNDGQFVWDDDLEGYLCDQATYEWWATVIADNEALYERIAELEHDVGQEAVWSIIEGCGTVDLEDHASMVNAALDAEFCGS